MWTNVGACAAGLVLTALGTHAVATAAGTAAQVAGTGPVATLTEQALFPVTAPFLPSGPSVLLYADGTVLAPSRVDAAVAPQVWPYRVGRVDAAVVETLLARAGELGLLANRRYPPQDIERLHAISHPPRTTVVLTTAAGTFRHAVDGLSASDTDAPRVALRRFVGELQALGQRATAAYQPTRIAIVAAAVAADAVRPKVEWPDAAVDLSKATACTAIDTESVMRFLSRQTSGTIYRQHGRHYRLAARVLPPGIGC